MHLYFKNSLVLLSELPYALLTWSIHISSKLLWPRKVIWKYSITLLFLEFHTLLKVKTFNFNKHSKNEHRKIFFDFRNGRHDLQWNQRNDHAGLNDIWAKIFISNLSCKMGSCLSCWKNVFTFNNVWNSRKSKVIKHF